MDNQKHTLTRPALALESKWRDRLKDAEAMMAEALERENLRALDYAKGYSDALRAVTSELRRGGV